MTKLSFYIKYLQKIIPKFLSYIIYKNTRLNEFYILCDKAFLYNLLYFLKQNTFFQFKSLNDICVVDYPNKIQRFEIIYNLVSIRNVNRLFVKTHVSQNGYISSIVSIFNGANWLERENWDMFGVFFANHPDLRRILTDYGFDGFPFRKDFPLTGYVELRYDDELAAIVYEPIEMAQEYRFFNFTSPWEKIK